MLTIVLPGKTEHIPQMITERLQLVTYRDIDKAIENKDNTMRFYWNWQHWHFVIDRVDFENDRIYIKHIFIK